MKPSRYLFASVASLALALAACGGGKAAAPKAPDLSTMDKAAISKLADDGDEAAKAELDKRQRAEWKKEFDAALAAKDEDKITALADAGNPDALHHHAENLLASQEPPLQRAGFEEMEAAADKGQPDAQLWVGEKMAWGTNGYPWHPASGMKMVEKSALQGNADAMFALAELYFADQPMGDKAKAKEWYEKAAAAGNEKAKQHLEAEKHGGDMSP